MGEIIRGLLSLYIAIGAVVFMIDLLVHGKTTKWTKRALQLPFRGLKRLHKSLTKQWSGVTIVVEIVIVLLLLYHFGFFRNQFP